MPKITALMTTYNSAKHVKETIDSILNQTYQNFIFLILDDGSTDNTVEIIQEYKDPRIKLITDTNNQNIGVGARLKESLNYIETEYIAKVDSDDLSHPERFEKQLNYMQQNPEIDFLKCYVNYFADNQKVEQSERFKWMKEVKEKEVNEVNTPELIKETLYDWMCFLHSLYFAKTQAVKDIGYSDARMGEDYQLFYLANQKGYKFDCLKEKLVNFRISNFSTTTNPNSTLNFAQILFDLKKDKILELVKLNKELWIYGAGGLAISLQKTLEESSIKVSGFFDKEEKQLNNDFTSKVLEQSNLNNKAIIIAAQPVRQQIQKFLNNKQMLKNKDYLIIG